ncbi:M14 family zinc carboxypeptidase [Ornithinimicrobium cerasi]|uniref:Zinc carboxypeptidase n=1 Tax=Ornithinimicrobium cerasi TaxID=2248773 RepID=A0A285VUR6_9MICO|nr:M14 family zinc carboxypeptidase [Ornithinimicrobium cerasi]SOC57830.1 Zinc carboxypeptidase [Ornithinimicrobium cerasi]SOC58008.1 Zinc carboxypeptidase [Ornithinimicrobium cerasi]
MSRKTLTASLTGAALVTMAAVALVPGAAQAIPENSHCGTEAGNNNDAFVDHAQLTKALEQLERTSGGVVDVEVVGQSNQGRDIYSARVGEGDTVIYVQTQIHGNENHGTEALLNLLHQIGGSSQEARELRENVTIVGIPRLNVDGGENDTRQNAMSWDDVVAEFPQLAGVEPAWNYRASVPGFDVNRDFNPDLDYVPQPEDFPGNSADTGWYITPEAQTSRDVYRELEQEFGTVDYFVDLHNQWSCYKQAGTDNMSTLSISGRFIDDPTEFGDWPAFDYDASRRANVAVYDALQDQGSSAYGHLTLYPQDTNLPGTALGSFALRGSATVLFETSSQTQYDGSKRNGFLTKQVELGLKGLIDAVADGSIDSIDPEDYEEIPQRVYLPAD